jgi:hypothetical protein
MALEVALACGLPEDLARRAAALLQLLPGYEDLLAGSGDEERPAGAGHGDGGWGDGAAAGFGAPPEVGAGRQAGCAGGGGLASDPGSTSGSVGGAGVTSINGNGSRATVRASRSSRSSSSDAGSVSDSAGAGGGAAAGAWGTPAPGGAGAAVREGAASPPIAAAEPLLRGVVQWLADGGLLGAPSQGEGAGGGAAPALPQPVALGPSCQVQPAHAGRSCVYVVRWRGSAFFYGGSTADVGARYRQHVRRGGPADMLYVPLDGGGRVGGGWAPQEGAVAAAEGELIRRLRDAGLPLKSSHDARRKRRGGDAGGGQ